MEKHFRPTAASEEFNTVPEGKTAEDNYVFGLFNLQNIIHRNAIGSRIKPLSQISKHGGWELMMLTPEHTEDKGLGNRFLSSF